MATDKMLAEKTARERYVVLKKDIDERENGDRKYGAKNEG